MGRIVIQRTTRPTGKPKPKTRWDVKSKRWWDVLSIGTWCPASSRGAKPPGFYLVQSSQPQVSPKEPTNEPPVITHSLALSSTTRSLLQLLMAVAAAIQLTHMDFTLCGTRHVTLTAAVYMSPPSLILQVEH